MAFKYVKSLNCDGSFGYIWTYSLAGLLHVQEL